MSDSESQFSLSPDEDEEFVAPVKITKAKPRGKATAAKRVLDLDDEDDSIIDSAMEDSPAPKKKKTTATKAKANGKQKLLDGAFSQTASGSSTPANGSKKSIEEIYQKKSQLEHILLRPDTYIGSVEPITEKMWVYNEATDRMIQEDIRYTPGLYKILDEILVNAADNKIRDPTMDTIKVTVDQANNQISVYNNGKGIPIQMHAKEKVYVPELIFGHLLTSSNYDDNQKKVTGGRNGYGAKLCNIFSTEFTIETADLSTGKKYKQVFKDNMSKIGKPSITKLTTKYEWTKITFKPDLEKFHMEELDSGIYKLIQRRVYDLTGCVKSCKIYFNDKRIPINSFQKYVEKYILPPVKKEEDDDEPRDLTKKAPSVIYGKFGEYWEVAFAVSEGQFQQVSFVNSINTIKGGNHVNHVADQICSKVIEDITKKDKRAKLRPYQVKNYMWLFVNSLIVNPAFDSQTKETLTLRQSAFGSKCEIDDAFIKKILKTDLKEYVMSFVKFKEQQQLKKTDGAKSTRVNVPKLEDANFAGGKKSSECTLILTEGDSAKALAVAGLSVIGRDRFGVFPLRGKLLNVRDASNKQITDNKEFTYLKQILGLKQGKKYESVADLRYGKVMIMADQDIDGSHIKGLILNLFDTFYSDLLKIPGFLLQFITPVLVAKKGKRKEPFFSEEEYNQWRRQQVDGGASWEIKYYKGLGTSSTAEGREYFRKITDHRKSFESVSPEERLMIDLAFNKKKADNRKEWLRTFQPGTHIDSKLATVSVDDFINKELITFSLADNVRSIPSAIDGLKPAQRKVVFGCFLKNLKGQIKVTSLSGYVTDKLAYHHGEASLQGTIINLAQDFIGSNNINLLGPDGQLGTRLMGGKDAASPRYVFVHLPKITRVLFHKDDEALLTRLEDEGKIIEPNYFVPVVPMVLVNGSEGIGTGWSTNIPNYNPADIVDNIRRMMRGEEPIPMDPWYRNFQGTIEKVNETKYKVTGTITKVDDETLHITELPIRMWTDNYVELLNQWRSSADKSTPIIKDYVDNHTHSIVDFYLKLTPEQMSAAEKEGFEKRFKLTSQISTSNMVCFDREGRLRKYETTQDIFKEFYPLRLQYYQKRKEKLAEKLQREYMILDNKAKFVLEIIEKKLVVQNRKKAVIVKDLRDRGYDPVPKQPKGPKAATEEADEEDGEESADKSEDEGATSGVPSSDKDYDYLLSMPILNLTYEKFQKLIKERNEQERILNILLAKAPTDLWNEDLEEFMKGWEEKLEYHDKIMEEERDEHQTATGRGKKKTAAKRTRKPKATAAAASTSKAKEETPDVKPAANSKAKTTQSKIKAEASTSSASTSSKVQGTLSEFVKGKDVAEVSLYDSSDSDNEPVLNFRERLAQRKAGKKTSVKLNPSNDTIKASLKAKTTAAPAKTKAAPKKVAKILESDSEEDSDDDIAPVATKSRPARNSARSAATKKSQYMEISDEDDDDEEGDFYGNDDDDDDEDDFDDFSD